MEAAGSDRSISSTIGEDFGSYTIVRRLGVGGMAETFEAIRTLPSGVTQRVCLKVVRPFFRDRLDFQELFMREARLAAQLSHSNIVRLIDFAEVDGVPYIALDLVDGVDLASLLDAQPTGRLSPEQVALLGYELARALKHAHDPHRAGSSGLSEGPIIHRDVSPSNVMVSVEGEILLTDFGLAKAVEATSHEQSDVKGKVPYMSPEQLRAEPLDGRSDLFALGIVLFEALSGQRPFQGEHDPATIMNILKGKRTSLRELVPTAPPGLCDVIESLLATDRDERPENAEALLGMMEPFFPSPRVRKELRQMAAEAQTLRAAHSSRTSISRGETGEQPAARREEASGVSPTQKSRAPAVDSKEPAPAPEAPRKQRLRRGLVWGLWTLVAAMAAVSLWSDFVEDPRRESQEPTAEEVVAEPVKAATQSSDEPRLETPQAGVGEKTEAAEKPMPAASAPKPARLTVIVFPWGSVWIDGKPRGAAPIKNVRMKPGRYRISAGQNEPQQTKIVDLKEAQRKTVEFDLTK